MYRQCVKGWTPLWSYWTQGAVIHGDLDIIMELMKSGAVIPGDLDTIMELLKPGRSHIWRSGHNYGAPESKVQFDMEIWAPITNLVKPGCSPTWRSERQLWSYWNQRAAIHGDLDTIMYSIQCIKINLSFMCKPTKCTFMKFLHIQGGSNMTGTNCDLFTHNQSWSYLNHLVCVYIYIYISLLSAPLGKPRRRWEYNI